MAEQKYYGIYQGIVTSTNDPEKRGRIKVKCPDVLGGNTESAWCDPMIPVAYDFGGDFFIPLRNEAVWVQFIAGDSNKPVWLGGWWSKNSTPLGDNYSKIDKVRIINYADCTILFQNGTISMNIGNGGSNLKIEKDTITINGNLIVNGNVKAEDIEANNLEALKTIKTNTATTVKTVANRIDTSKIYADTIEAEKSITSPAIESEGVLLAEHTHGGVMSGYDITEGPNAKK